jgi:hypothetical protein
VGYRVAALGGEKGGVGINLEPLRTRRFTKEKKLGPRPSWNLVAFVVDGFLGRKALSD